MLDVRKERIRKKRSCAFHELVAHLKGPARGVSNASGLFAILREADLHEKNAVSNRLAREQFLRENPTAELPEEFEDGAIAQYYVHAASLYGAAAADYVLRNDLSRAFKYYRKAATCYAIAARLRRESEGEYSNKSQDYRECAAAIRQTLARKDILRKRLSLGWLRRRR
jgi:hypothetical protein